MAYKVLIYTVTFYPHQGGMEKNSELLASELTTIFNGNVQLFTKSLLENSQELSVDYIITRSTSNFTLIKTLINHDVVFINGGISLPIALACFFFKKPFVPIFQMAEIPGKALNESKFKVYLKRKALTWSKKVVGVSKACLDSRKISDERGIVIYNPIDPYLEVFLRQNKLKDLNDRAVDLLFAGRIIEGKGIFILLDALKILDDTGLKLNVLFSGNGSDELKLKETAAKKNWSAISIKFQDFVRGEQLAQTYMNTKCMVLPSHTHTEGSPLSIAEAFSFGCAVIHSDQPAMCEQTAEAGISFPSGDSKALALTIKTLFKKREWNNVMNKALDRSELFSTAVYYKKLNELMDEIMVK